MRDELLVKLQALDAGDAQAVQAALRERLEQAHAKLALYERIRDRMLAGRSEEEYLNETDRVGPYLTLTGGHMYERQNIRWCERVLALLQRRSDAPRRRTYGPR
jgi:hypothetical protein